MDTGLDALRQALFDDGWMRVRIKSWRQRYDEWTLTTYHKGWEFWASRYCDQLGTVFCGIVKLPTVLFQDVDRRIVTKRVVGSLREQWDARTELAREEA